MKIGDKVVPINKTFMGPLDRSNMWRKACVKAQPFLYLVEKKKSNLWICHYNEGNEGGDYFVESDLVPYTPEKEMLPFKRGDIVEVTNDLDIPWSKRVFVAYVEGSTYPYVCVTDNLNSPEVKKFKAGEPFNSTTWKYCCKEITTVKLNEECSAEILGDSIRVGCQ